MADGNIPTGPCRLPPAYTAAPGPAPTPTNTCRGSINVDAASAVDWTAPNFHRDKAPDLKDDADAYSFDFEDLAFWTETASGNGLGGGGAGALSGVFMAPNAAAFDLRGGTVMENAAAQFVVSRLSLGGKAKLLLESQSHNAVPVPGPPVTGLVR